MRIILSGVSPFLFIPIASKGGITVLPVNVHKLQYVIHNCAALSMLSLLALVFNLGMEWRHKTKIKYPTKILEVKVLSFILHYPVEDH